MKANWELTGKIVSGVKKGAFFTQLEWFQKQCLEKLGYKPYPGTLNLKIVSSDLPKLRALERKRGISFIPPDSMFCSSKAYPVIVEGIRAAIVMPPEDVRVHGNDIVEIISDLQLKNALRADDGDTVKLIIGASKSKRTEVRLNGSGAKLQVEAVIFDLDGTLIDSIGIYYKIVDIVLERLGLPRVSRKTIAEAMKDGDFDWYSVLPDRTRDCKNELVEKALIIIDEIYPKMFGKSLKLVKGADEILKELSSYGMKIGMVTSTPQQGMAYKMQPLKAAGVEKLFQVIVTSDDVRNKKPAADPLVKCGKQLAVSMDKSVYIGDTRADMRAGKAAGMKTVAVLTGFDGYTSLRKEAPDAIIPSILNLPETIVTHSKKIKYGPGNGKRHKNQTQGSDKT